MKLSRLVVSGAVLAILPAAVQAQHVTLNQGPGICAGSPPNSYNWWFGMASGTGCNGNGGGGASNVLEWTYLEGAQDFNGMYFTGYGSFSIDLLSGENVLYTGNFEAWGENTLVTIPEFAGSVTGIRIRRQSGIGAFGIGGAGFIPPVQRNGGGFGPQGNGPDGNGPPGNGPDGNGPPGNGPGGNNGNNGNNGLGPNGGGDDDEDPPYGGEDDLNLLVNETNAAPEPATILLVASGLSGVGAMARRRRKQKKDQ